MIIQDTKKQFQKFSAMRKTLEIIGVPNGSGKSTFAETALEKRKESLYFNSDMIVKVLTLNGSKYAEYEAGREHSTFIEENKESREAWRA